LGRLCRHGSKTAYALELRRINTRTVGRHSGVRMVGPIAYAIVLRGPPRPETQVVQDMPQALLLRLSNQFEFSKTPTDISEQPQEGMQRSSMMVNWNPALILERRDYSPASMFGCKMRETWVPLDVTWIGSQVNSTERWRKGRLTRLIARITR
jgi:hypothetical protein